MAASFDADVILPPPPLPALAQNWQVPQPSPGLMPECGQGQVVRKHCAGCHGVDLTGTDRGRRSEPSTEPRIMATPRSRWRRKMVRACPSLAIRRHGAGARVSPDDVAHITALRCGQSKQAGIPVAPGADAEGSVLDKTVDRLVFLALGGEGQAEGWRWGRPSQTLQ